MKRKLIALCLSFGMLSVVVYILHVFIGGLLWPGYSHIHHPISDLTATGAPNRNLLVVLTNIYGIMALFFSIAFLILEGTKHSKLVFWGAISLVLMHIVSISYSFFPQDLPGRETSFAGMMHLVVTIMIVPFTILTPLLIGFGLRTEHKWRSLGIFSVVCGILILVFGGLSAFFYAQKLPFFGLVERLNIGTLQMWMFVLSFEFLRFQYLHTTPR